MPDRDDLVDLARLVQTMRRAQVAYFQNRDPSDLRAAKDAEYRVDAAVNRILTNQRRLEA